MTHDRAGTDDFPLTHSFLAIMLGVHRPCVTSAVGALQKSGLIRSRHGRMQIVDRNGLEAAACECYQAVEQRYSSLLH
jgi:hypothetical protein